MLKGVVMVNDKDRFFQEWKKDWAKNSQKYAPNQAAVFRVIRDQENLQARLERRLDKVLKELSKTISEEVYSVSRSV